MSPIPMKVYRGEASKSVVEPLTSDDHQEQSDNWDSYVEFYPASNGMASVVWFEAPIDVVSQALESIGMKTNFKGLSGSSNPARGIRVIPLLTVTVLIKVCRTGAGYSSHFKCRIMSMIM